MIVKCTTCGGRYSAHFGCPLCIPSRKVEVSRVHGAPDLGHPIIAYRGWYVRQTPAGLRLTPLGYGAWDSWQPGVVQDGLVDSRGRNGLNRGYHGLKRSDEPIILTFKSYNRPIQITKSPLVAGYGHALIGEAAFWGKVIEHEKGFRAQYAYPVRFIAVAAEAVAVAGTGEPLRAESIRYIEAAYGLPRSGLLTEAEGCT